MGNGAFHQAPPRPRASRENAMMEVSGLFGLLLLIADIYAIVKTVQSGADTGAKVLWIVAIIIFPVIGVLIWFLFGPRG
jgi:hypothetical protein